LDRRDQILTAYTIVLEVEDYRPNEEAFIVEARRKAREEKLAHDNEVHALKFVLLADAV